MAIKVFLLGRPGAGKSTAARYMHIFSKRLDWSTRHINDYPFLLALFRADIQHRQFQPSLCGGFDVIDFSVLDTVLQTVESEAEQDLAQERHIILLEFARDDYQQALGQFKPAFLHDAHFLFFTTDINTCIKRVYRRAQYPTFNDDHFISEEMIRSYYQTDLPFQTYHRLHEYGISEQHVHIIDNSGSRKHFHQQLATFMQPLIQSRQQPTSLARPERIAQPTRRPSATSPYCVPYHAEAAQKNTLAYHSQHWQPSSRQHSREIRLRANLTDMLQ
jgi:hypothetical protein